MKKIGHNWATTTGYLARGMQHLQHRFAQVRGRLQGQHFLYFDVPEGTRQQHPKMLGKREGTLGKRKKMQKQREGMQERRED
jgi:hypothetical protein